MIAEIHNKINMQNSNLSERSEDELTGNFFGSLRYIPFNKGLKKMIVDSVYPAELKKDISSIDCAMWGDRIEFWKKESLLSQVIEPDIVLYFDKVVIMIEVKLHSGLSSDDEIGIDDSKITMKNISDEINRSNNQLAREARLLDKIAGNRKKVLLLLAKRLPCLEIYSDVQNRNIIHDVQFGYITWESMFKELQKLNGLNYYEKLIAEDLVKLLEKKGFDSFHSMYSNINNGEEINNNQIWQFVNEKQMNVELDYNYFKDVQKGEYYEFRG